jgi:hypothetical protein
MEGKGPRNQQRSRIRHRVWPQGIRTPAAAAAAIPAADPAADKGIDLDITFNNSQVEQAVDSTYRPNIEPTDAINSQFKPFNIPGTPLSSP